MTPTNKSIIETVAVISDKLDAISEYMAWMIRSEQRFRVGQRVEWSRKGRKAGFLRKNMINRRGTVKELSGFSIVVKLDGQKQQRSYHHSFFNQLTGMKLF